MPLPKFVSIAQVRKLVIAVIGFTVLGIGIVLLVLPGPAFLVIPAGLAILAVEFAWARRLLNRIKARLRGKPKAPTANGNSPADSPAAGSEAGTTPER